MTKLNHEPSMEEAIKLINSIPLEEWLPKPEEPVYDLEFDFPTPDELLRRQFERLAEKSAAKLTKEHKQPRKLRFNPNKGVFE